MSCIVLAVSLEAHQLIDEVNGHFRLLHEDRFDAVTDVRTGSVECLVQHRVVCGKVVVGRLFEATKGSCGDEEVTHVVRAVRVCVDVFEAVGWCCHVLFRVVVADEVHDYVE